MARFAKYLAQRLRDALEESGKTKYRIAKDAGIHRQTVTNILNGDTWPNLTTIYRPGIALEHRLSHNEDFRHRWQRPAASDQRLTPAA
jgi:transcriptional regulator with XRE-family HTH domain